MGNHDHTHDYWHFTLRPASSMPAVVDAEGRTVKQSRAFCYAPGVINHGSVHRLPEAPGINVMCVVNDKNLQHNLEKVPFHRLTEEQLHADVLTDVVQRIRDWEPDQDFVDSAFEYYLRLVLTSWQTSIGKDGQGESLAEQALAFIEENYMSQIRLEDVAEHIGRSTYHTSRLVKEATGMNVVEQVREVRIKNACRMLAYSDTPVEEIMESCGFTTPNYFYRAFREKMGITPARYRTAYLVRHTFYEGDEAELDEPYEQDYFTYVPGARKCIRWRTPREYFAQKPGTD